MPPAATNFSTLRLIIAAALTILFCAGAALAIVGWTPGATGLPSDIAAIQESELTAQSADNADWHTDYLTALKETK